MYRTIGEGGYLPKIKLKGVIMEDFINFKKSSMFLIFPTCTFKCDKESGSQVCQNWSLVKTPTQEFDVDMLVKSYLENPITKAVVCGGLEPMDSFDDLITFINHLRDKDDSTVVIYTGYRADEIEDKIEILKNYKNIIIKFGRYLPGHKPHLDHILGVNLSSMNQYATRIENEK